MRVPTFVALLTLLLASNLGRAGDGSSEAELRAALGKLATDRDYVRLLAHSDEALGEDAESAAGLEYRAFALQRLGRRTEALEAYRRVLAQQPENAWALTRIGSLLVAVGRTAEAVASLERAVALVPESVGARRGLVAAHRSGRDFAAALGVVEEMLAAGLAPAWCRSEAAYLEWARGDAPAAVGHLDAAKKAGAPGRDVVQLRRLIAWEVEAREPLETRPADRAGGADGPWTFTVGDLHVESGLGPALPVEVRELLEGLPGRYARFYRTPAGASRVAGDVQVVLSRTLEEHEVHRRRKFPSGTLGRGFLTREVDPADPTGPGRFVIHAAWPAYDLVASLSHELAHAALHSTGRRPPRWLDEGLATYLEVGGGRTLASAADVARTDLLRELATARDAGHALSWAAMLKTGYFDFEGPHGRARYAQAWSMVHFLLHGEIPGREGEWREAAFLSLLDIPAGRPSHAAQAIESTYAWELAALEAAWSAHLDGLSAE